MKRIVIIDDEPVILDGLEQMLRRNFQEIQIETFGNGYEACEDLKQRGADVILSDVMMPEMTGLQLLRRIREFPCPPAVLMISGYDDFNYVREAMRLGAADYLLKPICQEELIVAVQKAMNTEEAMTVPNLEQPRAAEHPYFDLWKILAAIDKSMEDYLKDAVTAVKRQDLEFLLRSFDGYLTCAQYHKTERVFVIKSLSNWLYSLLSEMNGMIRVVSKYKLTEYDLTEQIRSAPTLSALRECLRRIWPVYMQEYVNSQHRRAVQMDKVKEFVRINLSCECQIAEAAALIDVSPNYLSAIFKEYMGMTFRDYVREERVKKSIELIQETNMKLYEIAARVGYQDPAHFSRAFKQVTGFAPQYYMKS